MSVGPLLNRTVDHWRPTVAPDGSGGEQVTMVRLGAVRVRVSQPSADERIAAGQAGTDLAAKVYAAPSADVRRGDELRDGVEVLEVLATLVPSEPVYLRADCERRQAED